MLSKRALKCELTPAGAIANLTYEVTEQFIATIPNGSYIPYWDYVITDQNVVLRDSGHQTLKITSGPITHIFIPLAKRVAYTIPKKWKYANQDVMFLSSPHVFNVGHWTNDFLTRLAGLALLENRDIKIAVPADLPDRYKEFLPYFDIDESQLYLCQSDTRYTFRNIHVFSTGTKSFCRPSNIEFIRQALFDQTSITDKADSSPKRIYISRADAGTRLVANEDEVIKVLKEICFEAITISSLSITERRAFFKNAETIVTVTGSNIWAQIFAPKGCNFIEMTYASTMIGNTPIISSILDQNHCYLCC